MLRLFKTKYRVVAGRIMNNTIYESQYKPFWCPFWKNCFSGSLSYSIDEAAELCALHQKRITDLYDL